MTEFTRQIAPVQNKATKPRVNQPTGNLVADVANLANTGLQVYANYQQQQKLSDSNALVERLTKMETDLTAQGLSRSEVLRRLDQSIVSSSSNMDDRDFLRKQLSARRGGFVRNQLVNAMQGEAVVQQKQEEAEQKAIYDNIKAEYNAILEDVPALRGIVQADESGYVSMEEMARVTEVGREKVYNAERFAIEQEAAAEMLEGTIQSAYGGVSRFNVSVQDEVISQMNDLSDGFAIEISNLDLRDPELLQRVGIITDKVQQGFSMMRSNLEMKYNRLYSQAVATGDGELLSTIEKSRDASLLQIDNISDKFNADSVDLAKRQAEYLEVLRTDLEITGLEAFPFVSLIEELSPQAGRLIFQAMVNNNSSIVNDLALRAEGTLSTFRNKGEVNSQVLSEMLQYHTDADVQKATVSALRTYYDFTKEVINGPALTRDLDGRELEQVSGGLVGILQEAANTDDLSQIREATKLLNSDNFEVFMGQLPEEQRATLGRYVAAFNEDVLVDTSDGIFGKLDTARKNTGIDVTFDATKNQFVMSGQKTETISDPFLRAAAQEGITTAVRRSGRRRMETLVNEANLALSKMQQMAQYEDQFESPEQYVHTVVGQYLPGGIKVNGELAPLTPEEEGSEGSTEQQAITSNVETITAIENRLLEFDKTILQLQARLDNTSSE